MKPFALILLASIFCGPAEAQDRAADSSPSGDATSSSTAISNSAAEAGSAPIPYAFENLTPAPFAWELPTGTSSGNLSADDYAHETLKRGTWETGILGGGGDGLGKSDNTQFMYAGGRVGIVLTSEHLSGLFRGEFEWAVDLMPIFTVFPPESAVYGGSIKPVIWQWNFTSWKKVVPYFAPAGGIIFTRQNIPPGDTSSVNFSPQASFGAHVFTKPGQALLFEVSIVHISNASLGNHNPGYNASIFFTLGYSWFHGGR
jgi:lipid A 3-O-deacylase